MLIQFYVKRNERLNFKDSNTKVENFIEKRLSVMGLVTFYNNGDNLSLNENQINVFANVMNPILDLGALSEHIDYLKEINFKGNSKPEGLIPGSQYDFISYFSNVETTGEHSYNFQKQEIYNNQFNLYKYKRLKIFLGLVNDYPHIVNLSIEDFVKHLETKDVVEKLLSFYEDCDLTYHDKCPHCGSSYISLKNHMSQPLMGFLSNKTSFYHECRECSLVFLSPCPKQEHIHKIYDEFDKQDFVVSENNPYHEGATRCNYDFISSHIPSKVKLIDLGGGIGNFSKFAKSFFKDSNITHCDFEIKKNEHLEKFGIKTKSINFLSDKIGNREYNMITMWEVIEHFTYEKLDFVFKNVNDALDDNGLFIFSTPDYDSPLCQMFDFYSVCPPYHPLCFSKSWLENYFRDKAEWEIVGSKSCSDFLDDIDMWMQYSSETSPSSPIVSSSIFIREVFKGRSEELVSELLNKGIGTEIIFALKKKAI